MAGTEKEGLKGVVGRVLPREGKSEEGSPGWRMCGERMGGAGMLLED